MASTIALFLELWNLQKLGILLPNKWNYDEPKDCFQFSQNVKSYIMDLPRLLTTSCLFKNQRWDQNVSLKYKCVIEII